MPVVGLLGDYVAASVVRRRVQIRDLVEIEHAPVAEVHEGEVVAVVLDVESGGLAEAGRLVHVAH